MVGKASLHRHRVQANKTSGPNTLSFFKKRAEFSSDQEYGNYVRANIKPSLIVQYMGHVFGFAFQCQFEFLQCNDTYKLICPWWVPRKPTWTLHRSGSNHLHRDSIRANFWESNVARVRVYLMDPLLENVVLLALLWRLRVYSFLIGSESDHRLCLSLTDWLRPV